MESVCNHDCFNCIHPDCICDDMTAADYEEAKRLDHALQTPEKNASLERQRRYYAKNRDRILTYHKNYYRNNVDRLTEYNRKYYLENRERILARQARYDAEHREQQRQRYRQRRIERGLPVRELKK